MCTTSHPLKKYYMELNYNEDLQHIGKQESNSRLHTPSFKVSNSFIGLDTFFML